MLNFINTIEERNLSDIYRRNRFFSTLPMCLAVVIILFSNVQTISADIPDDETRTQIQELFNAGNYHYEQQEYAEALDKFREIENQDIISGPLLLNIGLSYIQLQQVGHAKYYFTRALKYPEVSSQAEEGLEFSREWLNRNNANLPTLASYDFYTSIQQQFGSGKAFVGLAIFLNLAAFGILLYWFTGNRIVRRFSYYVTLILSIPIIFLLLAGIYTEYSAARWQPGLVVGEGYVLYDDIENPSAENEFRLAPGTEIMMRTGKKRPRDNQTTEASDQSAEAQNWLYIYSSNGNEGWIKADAIRLF